MNKKQNEPNKIKIEGKPKYIKISDEYNFFELFKKIQINFKNCFLFESLGEESNISRYHIIGFDPKYLIFSENKHELKIEDIDKGEIRSYSCENPYYKLRDIIPQNIISKKYAGGLVGFVSYDGFNYFETVSYTHLTLPTSQYV